MTDLEHRRRPATSTDLGRRHSGTWLPLIVAACGAGAVWASGWRGTDVAAQSYAVQQFRAHGWILWDNGWYGGHYPLSYSVLFPPVAATLGLYATAVVSAVGATWAFGRLLESHFRRHVTPAVALFALGLAVPVAIGQLPFLAGEAIGLLALYAARRARWFVSAALTLSCALFSPVAGAFLVLAYVTWAWSRYSHRPPLVALAGVGTAPILVNAWLFPGTGPFPFLGVDFVLIIGGCAVGLLIVPSEHRELRAGLIIYAVGAFLLFVVPNPLGGNFARLGVGLAPAVLVAIGLSQPRRALVALIAVPILAWQWSPALALASAGRDASLNASYYEPVTKYLSRQPIGRVEIPPTRDHWEAAYIATRVPIARGWERQVDTKNNPLFYRSSALTPRAYRRWLYDAGVSWVALPDAPLDYAAEAEAHLLQRPQAFLRPVWHNGNWRLWRVVGGPGLATGPARVEALQPNEILVHATNRGTSTIRVHSSPKWFVESGNACIRHSAGPWIQLAIRGSGPIDLEASLIPHGNDCDHGAHAQ